jgi:hypothetical protein
MRPIGIGSRNRAPPAYLVTRGDRARDRSAYSCHRLVGQPSPDAAEPRASVGRSCARIYLEPPAAASAAGDGKDRVKRKLRDAATAWGGCKKDCAALYVGFACSSDPKRNGSKWPILLKKSACERSGRFPGEEARQRCRSGGHRLDRDRDQLGELPEVLGGGCEVKLVAGAVRTA